MMYFEDGVRGYKLRYIGISLKKTYRCPTSLIIREIQIKTTMRYYLTPVRMAIIKKTSVGKDVEKKELLYTVGGTINWCSHYGKQYGGSSKN